MLHDKVHDSAKSDEPRSVTPLERYWLPDGEMFMPTLKNYR